MVMRRRKGTGNMSEDLTTGREEASLSDLQELHGTLARQLLKMVTAGQVVINEDGLPVVISPTPAVMNVVRQFLKDNNIQAKLDNNEDLQELKDVLPFNDSPTHAN
jgi:hypothetical protein